MNASIKCNGVTTLIYPNLFDALQELWGAGIVGWMWADIICICQDNAIERASQVRLMGSIYPGAEEVLIWLGPTTDLSTAALTIVRGMKLDLFRAIETGILTDEELRNPEVLIQVDLGEKIGMRKLLPNLLSFVLFCRCCRW